MAISVKKMSLWKCEVENKPGTLEQTLQPLAEAGVDLEVVMGYRLGSRAMIEVAPISGKRAVAAAEEAGLEDSQVPALLVTGDNRPGLGHTIARSIADGGINVSFLVAQVVGNRFSSVFGFDSAADAERAVPLIRNAAGRRPVARAAHTKRLPTARP